MLQELLTEQDRYYDGVLLDKYAKGDERTVDDVLRRVARGLAQVEKEEARAHWEARFHAAMCAGFYPAGRIMSAAGTGIRATLINCFVQPVGDSIAEPAEGKPGIYIALLQAAETMRRGGGVGYDFSSIRPRGARVQGTQSRASGPISYMRVFDRSCETVESAGARRGAQMGILRVDHPDIEEFVGAKDIRGAARRLRDAGFSGRELEALLQGLRTLSNFNISVAVTDEFMRLKAAGGELELVHRAEPDPGEHPQAYRRGDGLWVYRRVRAAALWDAIMRTTYETADPGVVFIDRIDAENNLAYCERIEATNPCGEQPLPDYGCCCLGSLDLARFVVNPFGEAAHLDHPALRRTARVAVRMLDNVLDLTHWPLPEQGREAAAKRRIGLGFTGLGTALMMLRLRYAADAAVAVAAEAARALRDEAYRASVELARERGAFPLFDAEPYLKRPFVQRLPPELREDIRRHGLRNSHLLSIAPTGTISLAFGRNVTGGVEPAFAWEYTRRTRRAGGETVEYPIQDYGYRRYLEMGGAPDRLPDYFVNAQTLTPLDHLRMQAAVQPFVDSSISKTVNVPLECGFDEFKQLYDRAYEWGCKGCTTYRRNDVTGAVLVAAAPAAEARHPTLALAAADRRLKLEKLPAPPLASLKWPGRPEFADGNPAWTYMVDAGPGCRFAVFVGHTEAGSAAGEGESYPFEVWVNGAEQPRGLGATAKLLSMDMRSRDRAWLKLKLEALVRTRGNPIAVAMPPAGEPLVMASPTAALARLVLHRCRQLGAFGHSGPTPVVDALLAVEEPRTGSEGTMSWTVDVRNPNTGDDCALVLKELLMPDGQRRPYAVGLYGDYPRDLDGLCRLLSPDMRVVDPAWIGAKLRKLDSYPETGGSFLARVPGRDKSRLYPSTVAYLAALMLHRYRMLGILDAEGRALHPLGMLEAPAEPGARSPAVPGSPCPECGAHAVIRREGCQTCTSCGWLGNCS
ncbi:MAG: adenosylcobalamin-dependent ribonucleoside-diphosphate reductase [Gammaproteobacteria bacterium]|nr:adenosylcobalamin-dependent ribonucleoside-diphosphate reductase [Gammaproteobacteria bacterium]